MKSVKVQLKISYAQAAILTGSAFCSLAALPGSSKVEAVV